MVELDHLFEGYWHSTVHHGHNARCKASSPRGLFIAETTVVVSSRAGIRAGRTPRLYLRLVMGYPSLSLCDRLRGDACPSRSRQD
jgi:hypothetical protein